MTDRKRKRRPSPETGNEEGVKGVQLYASPTHKAVVFAYGGGEDSFIEGDTISIRAVNPANEDVGTRTADNAGVFNLYFPYTYAGEVFVTVTGSEAGEVSGTVTIK